MPPPSLERREEASIVALGVAVGASATLLSLVGLASAMTSGTVALCVAAALALAALHLRAERVGWLPASLWLGFPVLAVPLMAALYLPPHTWDEVAYGAALPRDFAKAGRIFYNADYGAYAAFPANFEALVAASIELAGDVWPSQALNVLLALGLAWTAVLMARPLEAGRIPAFLGGLMVLCAPALIQVAPLTKNDVAAGLFQALAVVALTGSTGGSERAACVLSGAFLGVALGVKYSSLHFALALSPFALAFVWSSAGSRRERLLRLGLWAASLTIVAAPWYLRNLWLFSNPVFPFLNELPGIRNGFKPQQSELLRESFQGLGDYSYRSGTVTAFASRMWQGFGALPVTLAIPGVLLAIQSGRRRTGRLLAGTAATHAALTFLAGFWEPRYVLSLLALCSALAGQTVAELARLLARRRLGRAACATLLVMAASAAIAGAVPRWRAQWRDVRDVQLEGRAAFLEYRAPYFKVARWLNEHMAPDDRVAIGFNVQPFYYLERSYYHIHPLTEGDLVTAQTPDEVEAALLGVGATLLAFSGSDGTYFEHTAPKITAYRERMWMAQRRLRQAGRLQLLAEVSGVRILRIVAASRRGSGPPQATPPRGP